MTQIIAVANQKGSGGITTTVINIETALVQERKKVLPVDTNAQGNLTNASGFDPDDLPYTPTEIKEVQLTITRFRDMARKLESNKLER